MLGGHWCFGPPGDSKKVCRCPQMRPIPGKGAANGHLREESAGHVCPEAREVHVQHVLELLVLKKEGPVAQEEVFDQPLEKVTPAGMSLSAHWA